MGEAEKMGAAGCSCGSCGGMDRRDFLKAIGLGAAALAASRFAMAGPFETADFDKLVPADKKLSKQWIESLFARGVPEVYRGEELKFVGMPVGGICSGQVYLGGDGKLWHWDIFNQHIGTGAGHYAKPLNPVSPLEQGFALKIGDKTRTLDRGGFSDILFRGEYPVGIVEYKDPVSPVAVTLEAFSPFIPLNTDDSSLPATVLRFTVKNDSAQPVRAQLAGWLQNAVCLHAPSGTAGRLCNRAMGADPQGRDAAMLECSAQPTSAGEEAKQAPRSDIVFEDFEKETYEGWTVAGTAFGPGPIEKAKMPSYQGDVGGAGKRVVNTHNVRNGESLSQGDAQTGKLTSREFTIERNFITFYIGGGKNPGKTCLNLLVGGKVVHSATGKNNNRMEKDIFDVRKFQGKKAVLEIVDEVKGPWGNIGVDQIVFTDAAGGGPATLQEHADFGTMCLALLEGAATDAVVLDLPGANPAEEVFSAAPGKEAEAAKPIGQKLVGGLRRTLSIDPGQSAIVTFVIAWHFPNLRIKGARDKGRHYATLFPTAGAVAKHLAKHYDRLAGQTKLWRDTWYDSTLPYWLLDRAHLNTSILATSTCVRFDTGRFWAWEGVGCCAGTCSHVWHYAHAMGRQFPELERILREKTDFGLALQSDGAIHFRGENNNIPAIDAQAGSILRAYREHQMSPDDAFLKRIWPGVKKATDWLIAKDADGDGIIVSNQHNTLDTDWFGPVAWLSGLYLAALRAAEAMAVELGEADYAGKCRAIHEPGARKLVAELFNGEYFINKPDPKHPEAVNSGSGCEIDQVMGQSWAFQVGLPRVLPEKETKAALRSLWRYNFSPDVGPYREKNKPGRWYAMPGEAGLLMCTFPRKDWNYDLAHGKGKGAWAAMYFNECMNGFEYQAAGHMIWEGLVQEGLAVTRAVHDRYHASRRNPYNEVECGDHYARSMASYGVFLAACGFEYHGPKGDIGFAPRLSPEDFRAAFTAAEGWGTFRQTIANGSLTANIAVKYGKLRLRTIRLAAPAKPAACAVRSQGKQIPATLAYQDEKAMITLGQEVILTEGKSLEVVL